MISLRDAPIKRKLMVVIVLTTGLALLLMAGAVVAYEMLTFRHTLTNNTTVLAKVVGSLSTAALSFEVQDDAVDVLSVLSAEPQITAAAIYKLDGELFATFVKPNAKGAKIPPRAGPAGSAFVGEHLLMFQPIFEGDKPKGTIFLQAEVGEVYGRLYAYAGMLLFAGIGAIGGALAVSTVLQRRISLPIVELAETARAVSARQDYSVRATRHGRDEIGDLTDAFNQMLTRIGEARSALAGSEERLRLALEGSETGTWDWNLISGHATWDDYMFPLYGMERAKWNHHPKGFLNVVHPDDRAEVEQRIDEAIEKRRDLNIDFRIVGPDGKVRHMASRGRVFRDAAGNPVRMSGVSMDVTADKQTQEALEAAKNAAEAANRAKDEFLAILSHELRTPLSPVLTTLAMLEEDTATPAWLQRELEMIRRNVEVEARLIDDLLDVTRITRGKLELHLTTVDVRALLHHAVQNYLKDEAQRKGLTITLEIDPSANTHVLADASRITQVLWNLLQNACKFTPREGGIAIRVFNAPPAADGGLPDLLIEVTDTGIGIDGELLPRIFDAFEQGERSRTRLFGGLGLGLAISRAIIGVHGGSLSATSPGRDQGATFTVRLPTVPQPVAESGALRTASPAPAAASSPPARASRILLVEDHADTAQQLARLLSRIGHQVTTAGTLAEARQRAAEARFDLLLSDLGLPDGSGHDLMREFASRYHLPGIALSGYGMEEDVRESLTAGFSRHLTKPVNWAELKTAIQGITHSLD